MIYTSRYNAPSIGTNISISLYSPKGFKGEHLPLLAPTPELLAKYKQDNNWESYVAEYRKIIVSRMPKIKEWLNDLNKDVTLLCYEDSEHCHRHLVQKLIEKQRPELWGGRLDAKKLEQEKQQPKLTHNQDTQQNISHKQQEDQTTENQPYFNPYSNRVISDIWTRSEPVRDIDLILATVRQNWGNECSVYSAVQDLTLKERAHLCHKLTDAEREVFETIFWK